MKLIKHILFLLLMPAITWGQTVHVDGNRVVYEGTVKVEKIKKDELYSRAKYVLLSQAQGSKEMIVADNSEKGMISAKGSIRLVSPNHSIKTVEYIFEFSVNDGKYEYHIDSVYIKQLERGGKAVKISSGELLKGMDVSGPVAANAEKQLNEIDMNFQKLIALVNAEMRGASVIKNQK